MVPPTAIMGVLSNLLSSTSSSASMPTWVVSGNCLIAWVCALGSVLLTPLPSLLLAPSSLSILSVKVRSLTLCLLVFLAPLTTCLFSKQSTTSSCIRSICSVLLGYSVDHFSLLCMDLWLHLLSFVRLLKLSPKTMVTSSVKKKRLTTSLLHTVTSVA